MKTIMIHEMPDHVAKQFELVHGLQINDQAEKLHSYNYVTVQDSSKESL